MANEIMRFDESNMTRDSLLRLYSLLAASGTAKLEAVQKLMKERESGQLTVFGSGANVMFPRYIAIGTSRYPGDVFKNTGHNKLKTLFGDGQDGFSLPVYADLLNTSGIFVEYDESSRAECQKFTHNIMWSFLSGIPAGKLNISAVDCEGKGGSIAPFLEFKKKVPEAFDDKISTDRESVNELLKKYCEMIDERIQLKLGASFDSIIEYNRQNPMREEIIHLIVINDFPLGFGTDSAERLRSILKSGGKCGIYTIVNFNRNIKYSEYENWDSAIDLIRKNSDVFEIKENKCFHWNLTSPVESDIHISESAAEAFNEKYLDKVKALSDSKLPFRSILGSDLFEKRSDDLLEIPLGIGDGGKQVRLEMGRESSHHALIAGATGSGKSSLFHTLILSAMLHYSPDELNLYLMDFKSGTEFNIYEKYRLPHIKLLALDAKQEFGESILEKLVEEMEERGKKFKSVNAASLKEYKQATGGAMPRILVVIDEFQILFSESQNREVARRCAELAKRIVTEGRSFGIHLIMATQSTAVISELSISTGVIEQMRIRIGMKCGENDSRFMFRDNSQKALELMKGSIGTAVINPEYVEKENIGFRVAYCDNVFRDKCLQIIAEEFAACEYTMQTFEGNRVKKLFDIYAENQGGDKEQANVSVEVGERIKVAPPTKIVFDKKGNHNVLICGANEEMADNIFNELMLGALKSGRANVYFIDGGAFVDDEAFMPFCRQYQRFDSQFRSANNNSDIVKYLNEVYEQFMKRKKENKGGAIFVMLRDLQYIDLCKKLLKGDFVDESEYSFAAENTQGNGADDFFDFLGAGPGNKIGLTEKFSKLINDGFSYGIHFIISCTDYQTVLENMHYGINVLAKFKERFVFGMNDSNAGYLIDHESMAALDDNTVYYCDCIKKSYCVKPYKFPNAEELKNYIDGGTDDTQLPRSDRKKHGELSGDNLSRSEKLSILSGSDGGADILQDSSDADNEQEQFYNLGRTYYFGNGVPKDYKLALQLYEKAAEQGAAAAQNMLGFCCEHGYGVAKNQAEAVKWYTKAAEQGYAAAQFNLGVCYKNGYGVEKNEAEAVKWYTKAAEQGHAKAQYNLGVSYANGSGVAKNEAEAVKWYTKAAEQGNANAQNKLGNCYIYGNGVAKNEAEAAKLFRKAAEQGNANAQNNLGNCYFNGYGVEKNEEKAVEWYTKAAEQGHAGAQNNLGNCYDNGNGAVKNKAAAVKWYTKSAEQGYADAQYNLGTFYDIGYDVAKNQAKAAELFRKAAEQEHAGAQNYLGNYYRDGNGVVKNPAEAVKWYTKAADHGNEYAQYNLGNCYLDGNGVAKNEEEAAKWFRKAAEQGHAYAQNELGNCCRRKYDIDEAIKWYTKAAEQGHAEAQYSLGDFYYIEWWGKKNYAEAVKWLRKAAEQGHADAQNYLGNCYRDGNGVEKNPAEAVKWYIEAAKCGHAKAQNNLGNCYFNGYGVEKNEAEAVKWLRKAAEQGHAGAQFNIGYYCYFSGRGVEKNYAEAVKWLRKAAEQGHAPAQYNLGVCYDNGYGVAKNQAEAVKWYTEAAEQGNAEAQTCLGICYFIGGGVAKNQAEAVKWYTKAAAQDHAAAQNNLGICYLNGYGVEKNQAEAVKWYTKAAKQGDAKAQFNLGKCYLYGDGVAKNKEEAAKWFRKAAEQGHADAQRSLKRLSGFFSGFLS